MVSIEVINCPQCGGTLEAVCSSGFYTCPYCNSHIRVSFMEPDSNLRADGRTTVYDINTGDELCYIQLSRGWSSIGQIVYEYQSLNWPFTAYIQAVSPHQDAMITYRSGYSFKEVVSGGFGVQHREGEFVQAEMMPMMRRRTAAQFADQFIVSQLSPGTKVICSEERPLAKFPPENYEQKQSEIAQNTANQMRANTPAGMFSSVDYAFYEGTTRIYAYNENNHDMLHAVTTIVNGVQISMGSPMMFFGGKTTDVFWDVPYVVSLKSTAAAFSQNYDNLVKFTSTMQASFLLLQKIDMERNQILMQLGRQQQNNFAAHQRLMQEQQASFDEYNRSWMANSQRQHQMNRQRTTDLRSSEDRISDMRSEAIRGVNTYIRPDGTEVEYSVVNEHAYAYVNDSRTTFATQSHTFESPDWIEMKRKY